jgi:hypothetical protein
MWGDYLAPNDSLFSPSYPYLELGKPERFQVNRTINDAAWMSQDGTAQPEAGDADKSWQLLDDT